MANCQLRKFKKNKTALMPSDQFVDFGSEAKSQILGRKLT